MRPACARCNSVNFGLLALLAPHPPLGLECNFTKISSHSLNHQLRQPLNQMHLRTKAGEIHSIKSVITSERLRHLHSLISLYKHRGNSCNSIDHTITYPGISALIVKLTEDFSFPSFSLLPSIPNMRFARSS